MADHIKILQTEVLSDNWYTLRKITYEYLQSDGTLQKQSREAYDRGNKRWQNHPAAAICKTS